MPTRTQDAGQFACGPFAIVGIGEVVERPKGEHGVERGIVPAREVADVGLDNRLDAIRDAGTRDLLPRDTEQFGGDVREDDLMATLGQPDAIAARPGPDVEHTCPRR